MKLQSTEIVVKEQKMKKYSIYFYTFEDLEQLSSATFNIEEATSHDIDIIDTLIDNDKEHNFAHFNGKFIDLNKFAVIEYEEVEEDEE